MKPQLFSIGHSNQPLDRFLGLLVQHRIEALVDIRRFPGSRKYPHWNQKNLAASLQEAGIEYYWIETLGGRRRSKKAAPASPNLGLRNEGFRNYADYMLTEEFHQPQGSCWRRRSQANSHDVCGGGLPVIGGWSATFFWQTMSPSSTFPNGEIRPHKLTEGGK